MKTINLCAELISQAKEIGKRHSRTAEDQITWWATIGKTVEENPELPFEFVRDALIALSEAESGQLEDYDLN